MAGRSKKKLIQIATDNKLTSIVKPQHKLLGRASLPRSLFFFFFFFTKKKKINKIIRWLKDIIRIVSASKILDQIVPHFNVFLRQHAPNNCFNIKQERTNFYKAGTKTSLRSDAHCVTFTRLREKLASINQLQKQ